MGNAGGEKASRRARSWPRPSYDARALGGLFWYNLGLAARDIRRSPGLAITSVLALALACAAFTAALGASLHFYPPRPALPPALHQVELPHARSLVRPYRSIGYEIPSWVGRTRLTYPEYLGLAGTGIPTRETGTLRARLLVGGPNQPARTESVRFVNPDFFPLFALPLAEGRGFSRAEEQDQADVLVLSAPLARRLFGGQNCLGQTVRVDQRSFRVIGVVAGDQPYWADWDLGAYGTPQDAVYLPLGFFTRLRARPELPFFQSPVGPRFDRLLGSDAVFIAFWAELPSLAHVASFRARLDQRFGPTGYTLRAGPDWQREFSNPQGSGIFVGLVTLVLIAAGFKMARLLMAQGLSRREELGIHRALGATRGSLFVRQILQAALLSLPAAALGVAGAIPFFDVFNRYVADNDIPMSLTSPSLLGGVVATVLTGVFASLYPGWRMSGTPVSLGAGRL